MSHDLPDDWYEEHDGQRLVLSSEKVAAEIERLRSALDEACQIALGTDIHRQAVERVRELRRISTAGQSPPG